MPANNRLTIDNQFGRTDIGDFKGLITLTSKFGSLTTGRLDNVDVINVEFGQASIGELSNGRINLRYNPKECKIGKINGNVRINSEFSHHVLFNIADNIQELAVYESYSDMRMVVPKSLSARVDVHTSFGSFHNDSEFNIKENREDSDIGPHFDKDYSGQAGDGKARIKIKSSFGSVHLTYAGAPDTPKPPRTREKKDKDSSDQDSSDEKTT